MKKIIENARFGGERALYGSENLILKNVSFDGKEDGESALKESRGIEAEHCFCNLRYPFWHIMDLKITDTEMTDLCRAALWYSRDVCIRRTKMHGIKALRECEKVKIFDSDIVSPEFGWFNEDVVMENTSAESEYFMMRSRNLSFKNVKLKGKYSFQLYRKRPFRGLRVRHQRRILACEKYDRKKLRRKGRISRLVFRKSDVYRLSHHGNAAALLL